MLTMRAPDINMTKDEQEQPAYFRNKLVFKYGSIKRSTEEAVDQSRMQNVPDSPVHYEFIQFDNGPLEFKSIIFLPPGEKISMKIEETAMVKFKSITQATLTEVDVKVFARVVLEDGGRQYVPLSLMDIPERQYLSFVYERNDAIESTTEFVDAILIAGHIVNVSYILLKTSEPDDKARWVASLEPEVPYFGKTALDIPITGEATLAVETALNAEMPKTSSGRHCVQLSHLKKYTQAATCRTLFELRAATLSLAIEDTPIEDVTDILRRYTEDGDGDGATDLQDVDETLMSCYKYTEFVFSDNIPRDQLLLPAIKKAQESLKFDKEDINYNLLHIFIRDRDLSYHLMFNMDFGRTIVEQLVSPNLKRWIQREYMLDILIGMISHGNCMRQFLNAGGVNNGESLCDVLLLGVSAMQKFSMSNFQQKLEVICVRCELFWALSKVEAYYQSISSNLTEKEGSQYEHLETLICGVNDAISMLEKHHHVHMSQGALRDITEIRQYAVSYVIETNLPTVVSSLMQALVEHIRRFPISPHHINTMLEKPLWLIEHYINLIDFEECLLLMADICNIFNGISLNNLVQSSVYANSSVFNAKSRCENMCVQSILLKMVSILISRRSCPQVVSSMYRVCMDYPSSVKALADILSEESILTAFLGTITHVIEEFKSLAKTDAIAQENFELWQLMNLICEALVKDDKGKLLHHVGRSLLPKLEEFLAIFMENGNNMNSHKIHYLQELKNNLIELYTSQAFIGDHELGKMFESVDLYLRELLGGCEFTLSPDTLKQSFSKVSHIYTMSLVRDKLRNGVFLLEPEKCKSITRSMITENFTTTYCASDEHIEFPDVHWTPSNALVSRAKELGVPSDKVGHYNSCYLFAVPPEPFPEQVVWGIKMLSYASTMKNCSEPFYDLLRYDKNTETLFRIWVHAVAALAPDKDTLMNIELGAFKSLVGYEWFMSSEKAAGVIISIVKTLYLALHHLSCEKACEEDADEHIGVSGAALRYINDDMLTLMILSTTGVMSNGRWYLEGRDGNTSRNCIIWLCKLMSYWYHRYEKSQGYLMNKLMAAYISLPMMADGVAILIASCGPNITPNCRVSITERKEEKKMGEQESKIIFEGKEYCISLREPMFMIEDGVPNVAFWRLIKRIESLKIPLLADFMCSVASKSYATNPGTLVLTSELAHCLIVNDVPVMVLLCEVSNNCLDECIKAKADSSVVGNVSGKAYKLITFWTLIAKALCSNVKVEPSVLFKVNHWILQLFNKYAKGCKVMTEGCCRVLFEGYSHLFKAHNTMWKLHHAHLTKEEDFNKYMALINGAVSWICQTLNECKARDSDPSSDGSSEDMSTIPMSMDLSDHKKLEAGLSISWECVLVAFVALKRAFKTPFTTLNVFYTLLSGPMELIVKIINKQIDSEIIKVAPSTALGINAMVQQLCDALLRLTFDGNQGNTLNADAPLQLMILQALHDICSSIRQTGASQDYFIYRLVHGAAYSSEGDMLVNIDKREEEDTAHTQPQEDIYSDIVNTPKDKAIKKPRIVRSSDCVGAAKGTIFKCIIDALDVFRGTVATEIATQDAEMGYAITLSSLVANSMLILHAFRTLATVIPSDAMERPLPKSIPGYIFLKSRSPARLFRYDLGDPWSTDGSRPICPRSMLSRVIRMIRCEDWSNNTCLVSKEIPGRLVQGGLDKSEWVSRSYMFNGCKEAIEIWKAVRFFAKSKLLFADEMMHYAPLKSKKQEKALPNEGLRYIRSVSTRAPSKHVDAYESEKAGFLTEEADNMLTQANIEKAVAKLNGVITSQTWKDFDNDLVTNGLNLRSILVNPSILKDYTARATFLNALSRHVLIKELLISVGVDVR